MWNDEESWSLGQGLKVPEVQIEVPAHQHWDVQVVGPEHVEMATVEAALQGIQGYFFTLGPVVLRLVFSSLSTAGQRR